MNRAQALARQRLVRMKHMEVRCPAAVSLALGVAGAHEEPVRPGLKAGRVAQLRKISPDRQQRLLRRVLGEADVAQDPVRDRVQPPTGSDREARECLLIAALRRLHELDVHAASSTRRPDRDALRYGCG
jgi:hypothetical protein